MKKIKLIRIQQNLHETLGFLIKDERPIACTLELPWRDNARNISCIPHGVYECAKRDGGVKHGSVFSVFHVVNRRGIQIHAGNTHKDIEGCILVGSEFDYLHKNNAVIHSKKTMEKLNRILPSEFELEIIDYR